MSRRWARSEDEILDVLRAKFYVLVLMGSVVVQDQVKVQVLGRLTVDLL